MKTVIIIPARFGSTRFPGKPLALIHGISLLQRTWSITTTLAHVDAVYIATDDTRIEAHAHTFGAQVILTDAHCQNGTERVFQAIEQLDARPDIIINLQGDAVMTPPWAIQACIDAMQADPTKSLTTIATPLSLTDYHTIQQQKLNGEVGGTLVVFDQSYRALYFSKSMIPFVRDADDQQTLPLYRHIGLYGYRYETLKHYLSLSPTPLEKIEGLEQLRALEHGLPIHVVPVDYQGRTHWSVDSPADIAIVEALL